MNNRIVKIVFISSIAALGGMLFGYDTAVISGAIGLIKSKFGLGSVLEGWAAGSAVIGCIFGAIVAGALSDKYGRKKILIASALLISAIGSALSDNLVQFAIFRLIGGLGIGFASTVAPPYIAESAPAEVRGRMVSLYQLATVIGIVVIHFVNVWISTLGDNQWNVEYGWRWMLGSEVIPATLFFVLLFFLPESPRWLLKQDKKDEAVKILKQFHGEELALKEKREIEASLKFEQGKFSDLWNKGFKKALFIGIFLAIFQQFSGINAIMNYAPEIFKDAGASLHGALEQMVIVGIVNLLFTIVAIWLIDKMGRKIMLWTGALGLSICLTVIGFTFHFQKFEGAWLLIPILVYVAFFASTIGPVVWVIISEIFPTKLRGVATSIVVFVLWISNYINIQLYPVAETALGIDVTFWIYAACMILLVVFTLRFVPETKNKSLEEIEKSWSVHRV